MSDSNKLSNKNDIGVWKVLKLFFSKLMYWKWYFFSLFLMSVFVNLLTIIVPIFLKDILNIVWLSWLSQDDKLLLIKDILIDILITFCLLWVWWRTMDLLNSRFEINIMAKVWQEAFDYVHKHSYRFFTNNFSWSIVKRINRYVSSFEWLIDLFVYEIIRFVVYIIFILVIMFNENSYLWVMFLIWIVFFMVLSSILNRWRLPFWSKSVDEDTKISWVISDAITNNFNISIFWTLRYESQRLKKSFDIRKEVLLWGWTRNQLIFACLSLLSFGLEFLSLFVAVRLRYVGDIGIWTFILLISYQVIISGQLFSMQHIFKRLSINIWNMADMVEILDIDHEIKDVNNANDIVISKGEIEFRNVLFEYEEDLTIFHELNLKIKAWEKVAFVWPSWSGKSSIIKMLMRFFDIKLGEILIDNQNISQVSQDSLRRSIAFVPQEPILFHRTLEENIKYGNQKVSKEIFLEVCKLSHCHEFISKLPKQYDTFVGERGIKLSWGEKQRVAIARALLTDKKILVLDEATSSLDSESERLIQDAIDNLMDSKTIIVVAHRLSTIMKMDRIIVLKKGKIVEEWTHNQLLANGWEYKKLWDIQSWWFIV